MAKESVSSRQTAGAVPPLPEALPADMVKQLEFIIDQRVKNELERRLTKFARPGLMRFSEEDVQFLIWTLGFTAGAHLEKDHDKGERIFAWCKILMGKLADRSPVAAEAANGS